MMIFKRNNTAVEFPDYKIGDKFRAKKTISFCDKTKHIKGEIYEATEETLDYFIVCYKEYEKI